MSRPCNPIGLALTLRRSRLRPLLLPTLLLLTCVGAGPLAAQGTFTRTGDMIEGRYACAATLLKDGRVLVVGGVRINTSGDRIFNQEAEIYDPNTGAFTATGSMSMPRARCAAVRLDDGRVLVAEGFSGIGLNPPSAELFDPATGAFTVTGSTNSGRWDATASLLKDGRALIVGNGEIGASLPNQPLFSEIYDPKLGTFARSGNLRGVRQYHTSVSLADGRVLVLRGRGIDDVLGLVALQEVELFDPASGMFATVGRLNEGRLFPSATLLPDGRVLVAGGIGLSGASASNTVEIFDPSKGTSTMAGTMSEGREHLAAVALGDGRVLLAGGSTGIDLTGFDASDSTASADLFDPKTGKITPAAPLGESRSYASAVRLLDGRVLIVGGGTHDQVYRQTAEIYKP